MIVGVQRGRDCEVVGRGGQGRDGVEWWNGGGIVRPLAEPGGGHVRLQAEPRWYEVSTHLRL